MELPIPIIDLKAEHAENATKLRHACTQHGFFFVQNHGVPKAVTEELFRQSKAFFDLPEDIKLQSEAIGNRGYTALGEQTLDPLKQKKGDTKESYYICRPEAPEGSEKAKLPFHGPNRWPQGAQGASFKSACEAYMDSMEGVQQKVLTLLTEALGLPSGYLEEAFTEPLETLRPIHYTAEQSNVTEGSHTDWGVLTWVDVNGTPGLEVLFREEWRPVPCLPDTFVVNIGDLLQRWSNNTFKSTLHRVVSKTPGIERFSCAYFLSPRYDAKIECLPSCIGDGAQYEPVLCHEYLESKYAATHSKFANAAAA